MNILYINHYAGSPDHGMEYRPYYLAREWVKLGHKVTIVAASYSHLRANNPKLALWQHTFTTQIDGIQYIWIRTPKYVGNGLRRVINIFSFLKQLQKLIPQVVKTIKPNVVIASSTYPFDTKVAAKIAKLAKARFVYEVHDLWPLTPIELGGKSKYHPYIMSMQVAENFGLKNAHKVISILPKTYTYMQQHGMRIDKFEYIPNGVCIDEKAPKELLNEDIANQIQAIKRQYKFLLGYAGGMGDSNALSYLIAAAKQASNVAIVLVGDGVNRAQLIDQAKQLKLHNVFFLPRIMKNQVPGFLSLMDALYIGWHKLPIYRFGIGANKLFDYMLAAKPMLHSVTAGNDIVNDANCGLSVPAEDVSAIIDAINKLAVVDKAQLHTWGQNGYNYVIQHHNYKDLAKRFLAVI